MASNFVNWQNYTSIAVGVTSVTFGTAQPGLITPAKMVEILATGSLTINLPNISDILPVPPTTSQITQGVGSAVQMTFFNTGGATVTFTPYNTSPETDVTLPATISMGTTAGTSTVTLEAHTATNTWYQVAKV